MSNRTCDAIACNAGVATGKFMCWKHWRMVPIENQRTINKQHRIGRHGLAFLNDPLYLGACVQAVDAVAAAEGTSGFNPYRRLLDAAKRRLASNAAKYVSTTNLCAVCHTPILPGQPYNGATKNHWDCDPGVSERDVKESLQRLQDTLQDAATALRTFQKSVGS